MTEETVKELLSSYVEEFKELIDYHATVYKLMGSSLSESPMWFQYTGRENMCFMFKNSQKSQIWFSIPIKDEDIDIATYSRSEWIYDFFREVKYTYLKENHPTIYSQIK
jgi:hypothetical protein